MNSRDTALYITHRSREWTAWLSPQGELIAIPADEEECSDFELVSLMDYLKDEGFFPDYFAVNDIG